MRYHNITQDDMNNGDGLRVVLSGLQDVNITARAVRIRLHGILMTVWCLIRELLMKS